MLVGVIDEDELERVRAKRRKVEADMDEEVVIAKRMYDILDNAIKDVGKYRPGTHEAVNDSTSSVQPDTDNLALCTLAAAAWSTRNSRI